MVKTPLEIQREREFEKHKDRYGFIVTNTIDDFPEVESHFSHIEEVLHKVKLDMMTNVNNDLVDSKIIVALKKVV